MISIIIPCKDHTPELEKCLYAIERFDHEINPFETIVVNSHNQPHVESTANQFANTKVINSKTPLLAGAARNLGAQNAQGDILAFLDADCIPNPNWLNTIREIFSDEVVMAGGAVVDQTPWNLVSISDNIIQLNQYSPHRKKGITELLPGCNLAIKKEVFFAVGGFPDINISEDTHLTKKVHALWADYCFFVPEIKVSHKGTQSFKAYIKRQYTYGYRRGALLEDIKPWQGKLSTYSLSIPFVVLKRFSFIYSRIMHYGKWRIPLYIFISPIVFVGLVSWAIGFRYGCINAING